MPGEVLERLSERAARSYVPLEVLFEITHRCNLPCKHCYLPDHEDHGEMTLPEIERMFDQLASAGTVFLSLTGGEVCSRKDFLQILDAAVARGFVVKVLTNATMITKEIAEHFADAGVIEVSISVYGATPEVHDAVTDQPGSFERTIAGVALLQEHGLHVVFKTPLLSDNGKHAQDVHELARRMNAPCKFDMVITPQNNGNLSPLELQLRKPALVELMKGPLGEVLNPDPTGYAGPEPCHAGRSFCSISPTGDVLPCLMMPVPVGNVRERSFREIWFGSDFLHEVRSVTFESLTTCRSCDVKEACDRCAGLAVMRSQGVNGCDMSAKQVAQARVAAHRLRVIQ